MTIAIVDARQRHKDRINWLLEFPQTWEPYDFGPRSESKRILFQMMQTSGLYSQKTNWFDSGLDLLIEKLRTP